jgi:hypothetical protein
MSARRLPPQKRLRRGANSLPTSKFAQFGPNTARETRYTLPALADLRSILDYTATHSPQGAKRVQARIQAIIDLLLIYRILASARMIRSFAA